MSKKIKSVRIKFKEFLYETEKAILVDYRNKEVWFPKKFCWNLIVNKKMGGNMVVSTFILEKKGLYFDEAEADTVVEHHVPEKETKLNDEYDSSLFKSPEASS